jgi:hypothetical protein
MKNDSLTSQNSIDKKVMNFVKKGRASHCVFIFIKQ